MILGRYTNQPNEQRLRDIHYVHWLRVGETISGVVVLTERIVGTDVEPIAFAVTASVIGGNIVRYLAVGGAHLSEYKVTFRVTTNLQVREDEVLITVEEI